MKQHKIYLKINPRQKQIPIREQSTTFLSLYSLDLQYMFPWSHYDDISNVKQNYRTQRTENEEKIIVRKFNKIKINNHESEMDF